MEFNPFALSRQIENAHDRTLVFRRALRVGPVMGDPVLSDLTFGKSTFEELGRLHQTDPLRAGLERWVQRMTERRIHLSWMSRDAELERRTAHVVRAHSEIEITLAELAKRACLGAEEDRAPFFRAWLSVQGELAAHRAEMWARRTEIAGRMGVADLGEFWNPLDSEGTYKDVLSLAEQALSETRSQAEDCIGEGFPALFLATNLKGAEDGWPSRLSPDVLRRLLSARELFSGVNLNPGPLPARLNPGSFLYAGKAVGRALSSALRPRDLPFVVARDPDDLLGHETGALFALWMLGPAFQSGVLGLSRSVVEERQRHVQAGILAELRLQAARVLCADAALRGRNVLSEEFPALADRLTGQSLPVSHAFVLFRVRVSEAARFVALLSAGALCVDLREEHDEDWYQNPRAGEQLRTRLAAPDATTRGLLHCTRGLKELSRGIFLD